MSPQKAKAVVLRKSPSNKDYNDAVVEERPIPALKDGQVLIKMSAVALNHRDLWIRKKLYPGWEFGQVFGADGAGVVVAAANPKDPLLNKRVFLCPQRGWKDDPYGPESQFGALGGTTFPGIGAFSEYVVSDREGLILSPAHVSDDQICAWGVAGLTAWRATIVKAKVEKGHNVLITGIGGGVALAALQLCLAQGASVYLTSGSNEKIQKAISLGAVNGVSYKDDNWGKQLGKLLKKNNHRPFDAVIDAGGGDIMSHVGSIVKQGGRVVCYGMTADPIINFSIKEVLRNQEIMGSTMGSLKDMQDSTDFVAQHKIVPVISHVFDGLENAEKAFETMKNGEQFGKIVIRIVKSDSRKNGAKL